MPGLGHWYIEIGKQAYWRGAQHQWVNRYVLSGSDPSTSDANAIMTALETIEASLHPSAPTNAGKGFTESRAYGAAGGAPFLTRVHNAFTSPGTATGFGGGTWTGTTQAWAPTLEVCTLVEMKLTGLSSTGKPVFCRKFYRGSTYGSDEDLSTAGIPTADQTGINALVAPWQSGLGGTTRTVIGTSGRAPAAAPTVHQFLVNHQVPRGKKKPNALVGASAYAAGVITGSGLELPQPQEM